MSLTMDPWLGDNKQYVKRICRGLTSNNSEVLEFDTFGISDEEWSVVAAALKRNTSLKSLELFSNMPDGVDGPVMMSVAAALSLADALSRHPNLEELSLIDCTFDDFSAIALAIMQNPNLNQLKLESYGMTPNRKASIAFLVRANALESLTLEGPHMNDDGVEIPVDLSGAFGNNQSLKRLAITDNSGTNGPAITRPTLVDIAQMLRVNQGLETLHLDLCQSNNCPEMIRLVARGAKGHNSLKRIAITWSDESDESSAEALGDILEGTPSLQELDLHDSSIGDDGARHLARGLRSENCHLKILDISYNGIGSTGGHALAAALSQNQTLLDLNLSHNIIGQDGAVVIADALATNSSLQNINLICNPIGDDGASSFGHALRANHTLKTLHLSKCVKVLISSIPHMNGLNFLSISNAEDIDLESASALLKAIELNTTLESFVAQRFGEPNEHLTEIMPQVRRLLVLNRAGRRILKSETEVPPSLWPRILGRSCGNNPEAIYFFLRENPHLFKKQSALGKRKRGQGSCVIS